MIRPNERINRAILGLEGNPNWEAIKKWLDESYLKLSTDHIHDMLSNEAKYRVIQGQARELWLLRNYVAMARESLNLSEKERENLDKLQYPNLEGI